MTPIQYIGLRSEYTEGAYGSRLVFQKGEVKDVPDDLAVKLLRHPDVYQKAGEAKPSTEQEVIVKQDDNEESDLLDARDFIQNLDKDMLEEFAQTNFRIKLDKRMSLDNLRAEVVKLVDQYGLPK